MDFCPKETSMKKLIALLILAASPVMAHHGRGSTYDMKKELSLKGIISEVSWRNPHIAVFLDV